MRPTTKIFVRCENKGVVADTIRLEGSVREVIPQIAKFLLDVTMQYRLVITCARDEEGLNQQSRSDSKDATLLDLEAELEQLTAQYQLNDSEGAN